MSLNRLLAVAAFALPCSAFANDALFGMSLSPCMSLYQPSPQEGNRACDKDFSFSDGSHAAGTHTWTEVGQFHSVLSVETLKVNAVLSWNADQTSIIRLGGIGQTVMELRPVPIYAPGNPAELVGYGHQLAIVPEPGAVLLSLGGLISVSVIQSRMRRSQAAPRTRTA